MVRVQGVSTREDDTALGIITEEDATIAIHRIDNPLIIVVSGDDYTRQRIQQLVSAKTAALRLHLSGDELLSEMAIHNCACLFVELRLVDMDGLALFNRLKCECAVPPTIILANGGEPGSHAVDALTAGVFDYIEKPFSSHRFINALRAAIAVDSAAGDSGR